MPWLNRGRVLVSDATGGCYKVTSHRIAQGGFGEVYRGLALDHHRDPRGEVAIKVSRDARTWHGEAFFGRLLEGQPNVVRLHDAFQQVDGSGASRLVKYVLVFDWMGEGTVEAALSAGDSAWSEEHTVEQAVELLGVLKLLHRRGICHADITPRNVFVDKGRLMLGDLGIAQLGLGEGAMDMEAAAPAEFVPPDLPAFSWSASEDVYQVGLLALSFLLGWVVTSYDVSGRIGPILKTIDASDAVKGWLRDALGPADARFFDAGEAIAALTGEPIRPAVAPRSLRNHHVVFTGVLPVRRAEAQDQARRAGATVQNRVNGATTLVVAGQPNPRQIGQRRGTKLFDAHRRIRRGQRIAIIDAQRFCRLTEKTSS